MKVICGICKKEVDEVLMRHSIDTDKTTIMVKCHGDTDACEFDAKIWIEYPTAKISKVEAFTTKRIEQEAPNCPCHNQPCVWTSYNQALWKEPKTDHYSCPVTKEKVDV